MKRVDDPGIGQGRNEHHDPKLNRDALMGVLLVFAPWVLCALAVWAMRSCIGG